VLCGGGLYSARIFKLGAYMPYNDYVDLETGFKYPTRESLIEQEYDLLLVDMIVNNRHTEVASLAPCSDCGKTFEECSCDVEF
jgi:hypothetical protein